MFLQYLWGIETTKCPYNKSRKKWFLQYLWGIETILSRQMLFEKSTVFTVPMRNWNYPKFVNTLTFGYVFTVPMRNWNNLSFSSSKATDDVFTVPMRNWNALFLYHLNISAMFLQYLWGIETLPQELVLIPIFEFLQYLWGIETQM